MSAAILGFGTELPVNRMSQDEAAAMSADLLCGDERQKRLLTAMLRRSQVSNRHTCIPHQAAYDWVETGAEPGTSMGLSTQQRMKLYAEHVGPLSIGAASKALDNAGVSAAEITHLITVSCTGFDAPGFDVQLIEKLHLPRDVQRMQIGFMGCHAAINGMRVAAALANADPASKTLLCATELCSLHYHTQWDETLMLGNALFADGSAAFVCGCANESQQSAYTIKATGSYLAPDSTEMMSWQIGNHGFEMSLSSSVPDAIKQSLRPWLTQWLAKQGLALNDIGAWAVHPGGPRILTAVEQSLELPSEALDVSRTVLREYGNMSSPTVLFILQRMASLSIPKPCVALAFGPGLMIEAALLE